MKRATLLAAALAAVASACGGIEIGGSRDDSLEVDVISQDEADRIAAEQIDESNWEQALDEIEREIASEEADG